MALMPKNVRDYWERERPIELRPVDLTRYVSRMPQEPRQYIWIKAAGAFRRIGPFTRPCSPTPPT